MTDQPGATPADVDTSATGGDEDTDAQNLLADAIEGGDSEGDEDPEGADQLGDPGKKALEAMKAERRRAKTEAKQLRDQLAQLQQQLADKDKTPDEQAVESARREARTEALSAANKRILRSEVKAAAAGKLADPTDALRLLDLDQFEVGDDGEVDSDELADAISDLIKSKPYLAAQGGTTQFDSSRGKRAPAGQITREQLQSMTPEQINAARKAGRLDKVLGRSK